MKHYIMFGPPGAGKGTHSIPMVRDFNLCHLSTGDLLRAQIAEGTELGLKAKVRTVEAFGPGNSCYVQLDYERGSLVFSSVGTYNKSRKAVAHEVVTSVRDFLKAGKACEKHLADQLLLPLNVFVGGERRLEQVGEYWEDLVWHPSWDIELQKETLHYKTNQEVVAEFGLHE